MKKGMNLKDAIRAAERLGCSCWVKRGTGEYRIRPASGPDFIGNLRRKDAPAALISYIRRIQRGSEAR